MGDCVTQLCQHILGACGTSHVRDTTMITDASQLPQIGQRGQTGQGWRRRQKGGAKSAIVPVSASSHLDASGSSQLEINRTDHLLDSAIYTLNSLILEAAAVNLHFNDDGSPDDPLEQIIQNYHDNETFIQVADELSQQKIQKGDSIEVYLMKRIAQCRDKISGYSEFSEDVDLDIGLMVQHVVDKWSEREREREESRATSAATVITHDLDIDDIE